MTSSPDTLPVVHADSGNPDSSRTARVVQSVKSAVRVQESEIKRWRRTFDANAKAVVEGEKCVPFSSSTTRSDRARGGQVLGSRTICQCYRTQGRLDAYWSFAVRPSLSRRGHLEARSLVMGRLYGLPDRAQATRRGLLHCVPILRHVCMRTLLCS